MAVDIILSVLKRISNEPGAMTANPQFQNFAASTAGLWNLVSVDWCELDLGDGGSVADHDLEINYGPLGEKGEM
jgi:hypothetical protein